MNLGLEIQILFSTLDFGYFVFYICIRNLEQVQGFAVKIEETLPKRNFSFEVDFIFCSISQPISVCTDILITLCSSDNEVGVPRLYISTLATLRLRWREISTYCI